MWFWKVLGIEPTKDKTEIKRAFTKLAHGTNPEDDPEAYSILHEAYRAALDHASGKTVIARSVPAAGEKTEGFDFTPVNDDARPLTMDINDLTKAIYDFKKAVGIYSYSDLFNRPKKDLKDASVVLFRDYSALAVKTDDISIWDKFFSEPVISVLMDDNDFRCSLTDGFPEGDPNRKAIEGHIHAFEQNMVENLEKEKQKIEDENSTDKRSGIWIICATCSAVLFIVLFLLFGLTGLTESQLSVMGSITAAFGFASLSRNFSIRKKHQDNKNLTIYIRAMNALSLIFSVISWVFLFIEGFHFTEFWNLAAFLYCLVFTIAEAAVFILSHKIR